MKNVTFSDDVISVEGDPKAYSVLDVDSNLQSLNLKKSRLLASIAELDEKISYYQDVKSEAEKQGADFTNIKGPEEINQEKFKQKILAKQEEETRRQIEFKKFQAAEKERKLAEEAAKKEGVENA